jgi:predicted secreted hydrolase
MDRELDSRVRAASRGSVRSLTLALVLVVLPPQWRRAGPDYEWSFPRDHWAHDGYRTEWWYLTGHLGDRFLYQFTLFRIGVLPERPALRSAWAASSLLMGHAALTDLESGRHFFSEVLYREIPLLAGTGAFPDRRIGWTRAPAGTEGTWSLDWNGEGFDFEARDRGRGFGFRLSTRPTKPLVLQGPLGFSRKGAAEGAASLYYSFTRLATRGEVELENRRFDVEGESWMDKELSSSQLAVNQVGWDWFSLRLDDGRDLMLYLMRTPEGEIDYASGTWVEPDGRARYLSRSEMEVEALDRWRSPHTSAVYPSKWSIRVGGLDLRVRTLLPDQENRSRLPRGVFYWEGAVVVESEDGRALGRGFVEMTGYGEGNRPPV